MNPGLHFHSPTRGWVQWPKRLARRLLSTLGTVCPRISLELVLVGLTWALASACAGMDMAPYVARMEALGWKTDLIEAILHHVETGEWDAERLEIFLEYREADAEGWPALLRLFRVEDEEDGRVFPQVRSIPALETGMEFDGGILRLSSPGEPGHLGWLEHEIPGTHSRRAYGHLWMAENPAAARRLLCRKMAANSSAPIKAIADSKTVSRDGPGDFCVRGGVVDFHSESVVPDKNLWFTVGPYAVWLCACPDYLDKDVVGLARALARVLSDAEPLAAGAECQEDCPGVEESAIGMKQEEPE